MKRICLVGAAVAGLFTAGITTAASAATKTVTKTVTKTEIKIESKTVHSTVACKPALTVQIPAGETSITAGAESGTMLGSAACGTPLFAGLTKATYALDDSGDLTGPLTQWFRTGTITGTIDLAPTETVGPPTTATFSEQDYAGTVKITGGSEALKGVTGTGTMKCSTLDAIHYDCTDTLKLTQTIEVPVKVKVKVPVKVTVHYPSAKKK